MRYTLVAVVALLALGAGISSVQAAQIDKISGTILVDRGQGFTLIQGPVEVAPGTLIRVGQMSSAVLVNGDCEIPLNPGAAITVTEPLCTGAVGGLDLNPAAGLGLALGVQAVVGAATRPDGPSSP